MSYHIVNEEKVVERIPFKMKHQDNKKKFIKYWSNILNMDPKEFEERFISYSDDLFDNDYDFGNYVK